MGGLEDDIFTSYWGPPVPVSHMAGQLTVFRNTAALRHLHLSIPNLAAALDDGAQLGVDESIMGDVVFPAAQRFGYRFRHNFEAFQDHPNDPGFDNEDYYFERGRVFAVRKCSADAEPREGSHIHIAGIKRSPRSGSCEFISQPKGWTLPRWNLAATPGGPDRLIPLFASFHDEKWGRRC